MDVKNCFEERGVSTIVGALLVVSISFASISAFLVVWIPREGYQQEAAHMDEVRDSFLELKSSVELLELLRSNSVSVKMNADPIPLFQSSAASGFLTLDNQEGFLSFSINNRYYVDETLVFENGGIILITGGDEMMFSMPPMIVAGDNEGDNIRVDARFITLSGESFSVGATGICTISVSLQGVTSSSCYVPEATIKIDSTYQSAWEEYLKHLQSNLNAKGCHASLELETLSITIKGKNLDPEINDIYFFEKTFEVEVSVG